MLTRSMTPATNDKSVGLRICSLTRSARKPRGRMTHIRGIRYVTPRRLCDKLLPGSLKKRKLEESKADMMENEDSKKKDVALGDDESLSCGSGSDDSLWLNMPYSCCYKAKQPKK